MLTAPWKRRALAPVVPLPSGEWVPRGDQRLDDSTVERLALALHDRRHGDHVPERGKAAACARLSGAYDDALVERGA